MDSINTENIGITGRVLTSPKKEALFFDRIASLAPEIISPFPSFAEVDQHLVDELEWLKQEGFIVPVLDLANSLGVDLEIMTEGATDEDSLIEIIKKRHYELKSFLVQHSNKVAALENEFLALREDIELQRGLQDEAALDLLLAKARETSDKVHKSLLGAQDLDTKFSHFVNSFMTRLFSLRMRHRSTINALPIIPTHIDTWLANTASKSDVANIVLSKLPVPDEQTSWEHILDYRSDPDSRGKFWALRQWMSEVAKADLSPTEITEKLEYLLYEYERHLKLHKMKYHYGTLETVLTTSAEFFEYLVKLKLRKAANTLFVLKHRRIELLKAEIESPGSEVAYLLDTREKFAHR